MVFGEVAQQVDLCVAVADEAQGNGPDVAVAPSSPANLGTSNMGRPSSQEERLDLVSGNAVYDVCPRQERHDETGMKMDLYSLNVRRDTKMESFGQR